MEDNTEETKKKLYKFFNKDWDIIKIYAEKRSEANNLFKQQYPDKNIKEYDCIEPPKKIGKYHTITFSEWEAKELRK